MSNSILTWQNPAAYTDGSAYGQADNAGYTLQIDGQGAVSIPVAWGTSFDLATLAAYQALKRGKHTASLAAVSKEGLASDFSTPVTFPVAVAPMAPSNLAMA